MANGQMENGKKGVVLVVHVQAITHENEKYNN